jgi:hypothetical protein
MIKTKISPIRLRDIGPRVTTYLDVPKKLFTIPKIVHPPLPWHRSAKKQPNNKNFKY